MALPPTPLTTPGVDPSQIHLSSHPLGRGSFGSVWRGTFSGSPVAIKVCNLTDHPTAQSRSAAIQFRRESARYAALHHPCITQFFCVVSHPLTNRLLLVTELMRGGSLYDALAKFRRAGVHRIAIEAVLRVAQQIANGLAYLHASSFSFGDLKSMNVLLSEKVDVRHPTLPPSLRAKLCDFGLSRNLKHLVDAKREPRPDETPIPGHKGPAGTFAYMAPEAFGGLPVDDAEAPKRADIFALGIVMWELATLRCPWPGRQPMQLITLVREQGKRPDWTKEHLEELPEDYVQLVQHCWHQDALQRPTVDEVAIQLERLYARLPNHVVHANSRVGHGLSTPRGGAVTEDCRKGSVMIMDDVSAEWGHVSEELLQIVQVEEEELDEDAFALAKDKIYLASAAASCGASVQHSHFSDVTGESQQTGNNSTASESVEPRIVVAENQYVETEEKTEAILEQKLVTTFNQEDLEQWTTKVKMESMSRASYDEAGTSRMSYIEKRERSKTDMLIDGSDDKHIQPQEVDDGTVVSDIGAKQLIWSRASTMSQGGSTYVEKRERTKSYLVPKSFVECDDHVERELHEYCEESVPPRQTASWDGSFFADTSVGKTHTLVTMEGAEEDKVHTDEVTDLRMMENTDEESDDDCYGEVREKEPEQRTVDRDVLIAQLQSRKSYTLPGGTGGVDDEVDQELSLFEDEETLDLDSSGVNMFSRPHFRQN